MISLQENTLKNVLIFDGIKIDITSRTTHRITMGLTNEEFECRHKDILNLTDYDKAMEMLRNPIEDVLAIIVVPCILLVGLLSNCAFIYVVRTIPNMRTVTNAYLVNVSIADLIFIGIACSATLFTRFSSPVRHDVEPSLGSGFPGCFIAFFITYLPYNTSLFLVTFVTIERYFAICRPLRNIKWRDKSRTKKVIITSWLIGSLLAVCIVPRYSGYKERCLLWPEEKTFESMPTRVGYCVAIHEKLFIFSEFFLVVPFFLALILNSVMYASIVVVLSNRSKELSAARNDTSTQSRKLRNQVARLLIINGTVFFFLQSPLRITDVHSTIMHLTGEGLFSTSQHQSLLLFGRWLLFINSLVNPFVYIAGSSHYRQAFARAFSLRNGKEQNDVELETIAHSSLRSISSLT